MVEASEIAGEQNAHYESASSKPSPTAEKALNLADATFRKKCMIGALGWDRNIGKRGR